MVCDERYDCSDGSDEKNCSEFKSTTCTKNFFQCADGSSCIPLSWKCDYDVDCRDKSDEINCTNSICPTDLFSCGEERNRCIDKSWVCNGNRDCMSGLDEVNCTSSKTNTTCHDGMFK